MTDIDAGSFTMTKELARPSTFAVEDIFWGYKIQSGVRPSIAVTLGQALSFFFGVCFAIAALGIILLPTLFFDGDFSAMRVGSAALFGAAAAYLLWFASRGTRPEAHVDLSFSEIREVITNRTGKTSTVGRYPFDGISGVFVEQSDESDLSQLVIRCSHTAQTVLIATGTDAQLTPLRNRLAHDILLKA